MKCFHSCDCQVQVSKRLFLGLAKSFRTDRSEKIGRCPGAVTVAIRTNDLEQIVLHQTHFLQSFSLLLLSPSRTSMSRSAITSSVVKYQTLVVQLKQEAIQIFTDGLFGYLHCWRVLSFWQFLRQHTTQMTNKPQLKEWTKNYDGLT